MMSFDFCMRKHCDSTTALFHNNPREAFALASCFLATRYGRRGGRSNREAGRVVRRQTLACIDCHLLEEVYWYVAAVVIGAVLMELPLQLLKLDKYSIRNCICNCRC